VDIGVVVVVAEAVATAAGDNAGSLSLFVEKGADIAVVAVGSGVGVVNVNEVSGAALVGNVVVIVFEVGCGGWRVAVIKRRGITPDMYPLALVAPNC
jgi:hypothetical protein